MPQQINLLDPTLLAPRQRLSPRTTVAAVGAAAVLVLGHFTWEQAALAHALQQATAGAGPAAGPEETSAAVGQAASAALARLAQGEMLRDFLRAQAGVPEGRAALMQAVIKTLPNTLWLVELEVGPGLALRVTGGTTSTPDFGRYVDELSRIPGLQGLPLHTVRLEPAQQAADGAELPAGASTQMFVLSSGDNPSNPAPTHP